MNDPRPPCDTCKNARVLHEGGKVIPCPACTVATAPGEHEPPPERKVGLAALLTPGWLRGLTNGPPPNDLRTVLLAAADRIEELERSEKKSRLTELHQVGDQLILNGLTESAAVVRGAEREIVALRARLAEAVAPKGPIPMRLLCPVCGELHVDEGEFATRAHHTHACQACGHVWRPAVVATVGVRFLPGFKNDAEKAP